MRNKAANGKLLNIKEVILLVSRAVGVAMFGVALLSVSYELILRPRHVFNVKYEHFLSANPKVLLLADSRGVHAIRRTDANFYNYAHFGEYPFAQILRARHAMRDKPSIRVIVMQLDPYVLLQRRAYSALLSSRGFYEPLLFSTLDDVRQVVRPDRLEFWRNLLGFVFPLSIWWEREDFWGALRQSLTSIGIDNAPRQMRYLNTCGDLVNHHPSLTGLSDSERRQLAWSEAESRYKNNKFQPATAELVEEFLGLASSRGVRVIGIRFPETAEYREAAASLIDPAAESFIASLRIPVLDYRDGLSPDLFSDVDHLSDTGARALSLRFTADVLSLANISAEPLNCTSQKPLRIRTWPYEDVLKALYRLALG